MSERPSTLRPRAIIVVAYGSIDHLVEALDPLGAEEIVVVDNSSAAATRAHVEGLGHTYLDPGANLGFAGGVNVGLRHLASLGGGRDVLLLNPDARIRPEGIDVLQAGLLAGDDIAAAAPALVGPDGATHLTWYPLPSPRQMWRFALRAPFIPPERDFLIGASLMLRAEAVVDVGLFDERYFLYGEEADWQRRAFDKGWRVVEVDGARAVHHGGGSSDDDAVRVARVTAGQDLYVRTWYGARGSASFRLAGWLSMAVRSSSSWPTARELGRCFRLGPRRTAPLPPSPRPLTVLHLVRPGGDPAAVASLALAQARAGHQVSVVAPGEPPVDVTGEPGLTWSDSASSRGAVRAALHAGTAWDVVHAHGPRAVVRACVTGAWHGARVVATTPGNAHGPAAFAVARLRARVDSEVALAGFDPADGYRVAGAPAGRRNRNIA